MLFELDSTLRGSERRVCPALERASGLAYVRPALMRVYLDRSYTLEDILVWGARWESGRIRILGFATENQ